MVLVSHSRALAAATERLVRQMAGESLSIALAAGAGPDSAELGTDATAILAAFEALAHCAAIVVLMDIGSAVLSAELARDLADEEMRTRIHVSPAPFVEGALAAGVAAASGLSVARVLAEALSGLAQKQFGLEPPAVAPDGTPVTASEITRVATVTDPKGLHLRPAAQCVDLAARFDATIRFRNGVRTAGADSLTALMALGIAGGGTVTIEATGPDAARAADALATLLAATPAAPESEGTPNTVPDQGAGPVPISPGRVAGSLFAAARVPPVVSDHQVADREAARTRLDAAIETARAALTGDPILRAQAALLADPAILGPARAAIAREGWNEAAAWQAAVAAAAATYAALEDPYLRARARDVREAGNAVLRALLRAGGLALPLSPAILLVDELTAAEAASLPPEVLGVLDRRGGPTSHATILLRAAGIPALANVTLEPPPQSVAFDGATAEIVPDPDEETARRFSPTAVAAGGAPTLALSDGTTLELWANVAGPIDSAAAARAGAYGIGLARTEILFLDRADAPSEEEQRASIAAMLAPFAGRPVTVRLLDAGADKPVPFLRLGREENPALGVRGIRAALRHPDFLATHLRAILRAGAGHDLRIMVPMVTLPAEMAETRAILEHVAAALGRAVPPLGAMVEVPAAAMRIPDFVPVCDFFSIGTNDLTQYVLAADRGHKDLAAFADAGHPAIIELCARVARDAAGRPVSVCGEAAGEPVTAHLLIEVGIRRLSMGAVRLAPIRAAFKRAEPMRPLI
ncbi:MAG TPA: dihydroxyacetone kinase phosphoryl donor subunit DhaM [Acetobacteraceae bacterium]|nr:dihydroxyacetone kinase phosphoryl donor subunit DhaM [Acetobacteraceae bacterium]